MKLISISLIVLALAMGSSFAYSVNFPMQSNSENTESRIRNKGWSPFTTQGFPWWIALEDIQDQEAAIFVFLEPKYFTKENLHQIFNHLSGRVRSPRLEITVLSDEGVLKETLKMLPENKAIGIFDFFENERGREGRRKYLEREASEGKGCYRAFYTRSLDGKERFKYTQEPDKEDYIWIRLEGGSLKEDTRMELIQAVEHGDITAIERLLSMDVSLDIESHTGHTLLMFQPRRNKEAIVKLLLRAGEKIGARDKYGRTPLRHAVENGDVELVRILLDQGADVDTYDISGNSALLLAARKQYPAVVEVLVERGGNVNRSNRFGITPLMYAAGNGDVRSIKALLSKGAYPDARDNNGSTCLFYANVESGSVVDALIDAGADVDARDKEGCTPLMQAVLMYDSTMVKALIKRGANVFLKDSSAKSALDLARDRFGPSDSITKLLESAGAKR